VYLENLRLQMPDGVRLNAFLYLPQAMAHGSRLPAVLNTTPYRFSPHADSYFARHGYASLFLDVRGTGGSDGIPTDEYSHEEHQDTAHVIAWLARQPWSNGNVGMYGVSYSAFNSVWVAAALKPPALKAIFVQAGTDNRYTDDIHYPGGSMLMVDNSWALGMLTMNAMPAAPDFDLDSAASLARWNTPPWMQGFLRRQLDGPYWRHGSLAPDYSRLAVPTFLTGGYLDIYQNFVPRIMRNASNAPTYGILGPWHHSQREPGPYLDWDALKVRWFDHWLKGHDTGLLREPRVSFFLPEWRRQSFRYEGAIPGAWRYLDAWPDTVYEPTLKLFFRPEPERPSSDALAGDPAPGEGGRLADLAGPASALRLTYYPGTGAADQSFGPTSGEGWYGLDRRDQDTWGLAFDTPPLTGPVELLGFARAQLHVSTTAPVANWIVRLCDVAPDGTSYLVARGNLNGTHRHSHTLPEAMVPGETYELAVELFCTAYRFARGHRLRIVVANADFPLLWPSPYPMITTLHTGGTRPSHIALPVLRQDLAYRNGALPVAPAPAQSERESQRVAPDGSWYTTESDPATGTHAATVNLPLGGRIRCKVVDDDPASAELEVNGSDSGTQGERRIEVRSSGTLRSTRDEFAMAIKVSLFENDRLVREREWTDRVKRELV
jgi:putative CocE/NonD family hydrolase